MTTIWSLGCAVSISTSSRYFARDESPRGAAPSGDKGDRQTPEGWAALRQRTVIEHSLAPLGHWQGRRAHYRGTRKDLFDLRRCADVDNLHVIARHQILDQHDAITVAVFHNLPLKTPCSSLSRPSFIRSGIMGGG